VKGFDNRNGLSTKLNGSPQQLEEIGRGKENRGDFFPSPVNVEKGSQLKKEDMESTR